MIFFLQGILILTSLVVILSQAQFSVLVCAAAADDPGDGAPDPRDAHPGRLHYTRCGRREGRHLHPLDEQGEQNILLERNRTKYLRSANVILSYIESTSGLKRPINKKH